jgi:hypothetical protein
MTHKISKSDQPHVPVLTDMIASMNLKEATPAASAPEPTLTDREIPPGFYGAAHKCAGKFLSLEIHRNIAALEIAKHTASAVALAVGPLEAENALLESTLAKAREYEFETTENNVALEARVKEWQEVAARHAKIAEGQTTRAAQAELALATAKERIAELDAELVTVRESFTYTVTHDRIKDLEAEGKKLKEIKDNL